MKHAFITIIIVEKCFLNYQDQFGTVIFKLILIVKLCLLVLRIFYALKFYKNSNVSRILKMKPLKGNGCNIKRPFIQQTEIGYFNDPIHISQGV